MFAITIRNLKIFFRDKTSIFFSLLAVFIIIGLYVLFLGDTLVDDFKALPHADFLISSWVMAGILAVTAVTTTLGAFGIMVDDRSKKIMKDFNSSPIKKSQLTGGYILSSFIIGVIMTIITFILIEIYIVSSGGELLSFINILKILGIILLSVISSSSLVFFIVSFFKSQSAYTTASTVIGTLIGFITGIYIPIGILPESVQFIIKIFPISHAASIFRQIMLIDPINSSFANAPTSAIESFNIEMGTYFQFGDFTTNISTSIIVLIVTTIVFFLLSTLNISRKNK